jgi:FAD/FMN-containing dehydrogenase
MVAESRDPRVKQIASGVLDLENRLRGRLILPGDADYNAARAVHNAVFDRRPALVVRAVDEADVIAAIAFAREQNLPFAVRSGGHSFSGQGTVDGGLVLDLSAMKGFHIDPARRVSRVQPGITWGEYARQAQVYGLATSSGDTATVSVGGLTLNGGIGWMVRKHGLTIDHLRAVELVTADGRLVRAADDENPDLFWALRGGGGNFGVATAFELDLHPAGTVLGGLVAYSGADVKRVLREWAAFATEASDELTTTAWIMQAPPMPFVPHEWHGKPIVALAVCYAGDLATGERVLAPLRSLVAPVTDIIGPLPYAGIFALTDDATAPGRDYDVRSGYLDHLDDELLDTIEAFGREVTSLMSMVHIRMLGGAMARVPAAATAFAHRDKPFMIMLANVWWDGNPERHRRWIESFWQAVRPNTSGAYVGFLADEGDERVRDAYPKATYERLAGVKRLYDPENFFRLNQNIRPQAEPSA